MNYRIFFYRSYWHIDPSLVLMLESMEVTQEFIDSLLIHDSAFNIHLLNEDKIRKDVMDRVLNRNSRTPMPLTTKNILLLNPYSETSKKIKSLFALTEEIIATDQAFNDAYVGILPYQENPPSSLQHKPAANLGEVSCSFKTYMEGYIYMQNLEN